MDSKKAFTSGSCIDVRWESLAMLLVFLVSGSGVTVAPGFVAALRHGEKSGLPFPAMLYYLGGLQVYDDGDAGSGAGVFNE